MTAELCVITAPSHFLNFSIVFKSTYRFLIENKRNLFFSICATPWPECQTQCHFPAVSFGAENLARLQTRWNLFWVTIKMLKNRKQQFGLRFPSQNDALSFYWRFGRRSGVQRNKNYLQCGVCAYLMDLFVESHRQPVSGWRWTAKPTLIFGNAAICAGDDVASAAQCNYNPYLMGRCGAFRMSNADSDSSSRTILDKLINFWCQRFQNLLSLMGSQKAFLAFPLIHLSQHCSK